MHLPCARHCVVLTTALRSRIGLFADVKCGAQRGYLTCVHPQSWRNKELGFGHRSDQLKTPLP